jgi:hypothetical protein
MFIDNSQHREGAIARSVTALRRATKRAMHAELSRLIVTIAATLTVSASAKKVKSQLTSGPTDCPHAQLRKAVIRHSISVNRGFAALLASSGVRLKLTEAAGCLAS